MLAFANTVILLLFKQCVVDYFKPLFLKHYFSFLVLITETKPLFIWHTLLIRKRKCLVCRIINQLKKRSVYGAREKDFRS
ncbi:MAG: hypothetical protein JWP12_2295 [Bacteroidetes bacterium]|nr:hypothetical protein [Bacteroidota bacterium]